MSSVYAFVAWISTIISYFIFLIWAFTPETVLHYYGITYYPSRYYAVALPAYTLVILFLGGIFYMGLNMLGTLDPDDLRTVEDSQTIRGSNEPVRYFDKTGYDPVPEIGDMDPCAVTDWLAYSRHSVQSTIGVSAGSSNSAGNIGVGGVRVRSQRKSGSGTPPSDAFGDDSDSSNSSSSQTRNSKMGRSSNKHSRHGGQYVGSRGR